MKVVKLVETIDTKAGKAVYNYELDAYVIKKGDARYLFALDEVPYVYLDGYLFGGLVVVVDGRSDSDVEMRIDKARQYIEEQLAKSQ